MKITLGSIWLCVTGLLTNEEQQNSRNTETRLCALKCVLELIKIEVSQYKSSDNRLNSDDWLRNFGFLFETLFV